MSDRLDDDIQDGFEHMALPQPDVSGEPTRSQQDSENRKELERLVRKDARIGLSSKEVKQYLRLARLVGPQDTEREGA
jgi:hypothetical protein